MTDQEIAEAEALLSHAIDESMAVTQALTFRNIARRAVQELKEIREKRRELRRERALRCPG